MGCEYRVLVGGSVTGTSHEEREVINVIAEWSWEDQRFTNCMTIF